MDVEIELEVNGLPKTAVVPARTLLVDLLREHLGLSGTKVGCAHGVCGSCTVELDGVPVRSCLSLAAQASGHRVRTVEGLGSGDHLHPLQTAFWEQHGLQCGFCTPGLLMTAVSLVERGTPVNEEDAREAIAGNLCRCTGYDTVVTAVSRAATAMGERSSP